MTVAARTVHMASDRAYELVRLVVQGPEMWGGGFSLAVELAGSGCGLDHS